VYLDRRGVAGEVDDPARAGNGPTNEVLVAVGAEDGTLDPILCYVFILTQGKILFQGGEVELDANVVELLGHPSKRCQNERIVVALACPAEVSVISSEGNLLETTVGCGPATDEG